MQNIELLEKNVNGVQGSFLLKDGRILECNLEQEKVRFISKSIQFLTESFAESNKDLKKIIITADKTCTLLFHDQYLLGIVASQDTNFALLDIISTKLLMNIEEPAEKTEKAVDSVVERMQSFIG